MIRDSRPRSALVAALLTALSASDSTAQNRVLTPIVASGFQLPVFVTHAGDGSNRLFVVEQAGVIRILDAGAVLGAPFLDLTAMVGSGGERGLLGLAFHPSYEQNGFFYVNYTDLAGNTVIARYSVSGDPDVANPASALVLLQVAQPFANHNGGMLQFGPFDDYLYVALGDGGSGNDPFGHGQNKNTLLGSLLRLDVDGGSPYAIPAGNPFVGTEGADEIWAFGLRNPWRFSFDRETGDLLIGDVGQSRWEEIDFQPAGAEGGRNFGWAVREGPCPRGALLPCPPATAGWIDPVSFYGRSAGASVTGGFVYRGTDFPALVGRYFFADFISGRIWSLSKTGPATWGPLELEAETGFNISSFGEDEQGRLYVVDYSGGNVRFLQDTGAPRSGTALMAMDVPLPAAAVPQSFTVAGWAIDPSASGGTGVTEVEILAFPEAGGSIPLGAATYGIARPDVAAFFGDGRFESSGFRLDVAGLAAGRYTLRARARSFRGTFDAMRDASVTVGTDPHLNVESPVPGAILGAPVTVQGWAIDRAASTGPGVDAVHVWSSAAGSSSPTFLGSASTGESRPDVAGFFGDAKFQSSGFSLVSNVLLPAGDYTLQVWARSTVTGTFNNLRLVPVRVVGVTHLSVDVPAAGAHLGTSFTVSGWALNTGAVSGAGVDAVHLWAYSSVTGAGTFLGSAALGLSRPDVAAFFGDSRFDPSGFSLSAGPLAPGSYVLRVFARNAASGQFDAMRDVLVSVTGSSPVTAVDAPEPGPLMLPFTVSGWAVDREAVSGTGVDAVHVWATSTSGGSQIFLGAATLGIARPDVAQFFGNSELQSSGYRLDVSALPAGNYLLVVWARSTISGSFTHAAPVEITVP